MCRYAEDLPLLLSIIAEPSTVHELRLHEQVKHANNSNITFAGDGFYNDFGSFGQGKDSLPDLDGFALGLDGKVKLVRAGELVAKYLGNLMQNLCHLNYSKILF